MRALLQRVSRASVHVDGQLVSTIGLGLVVLVGVRSLDGDADVRWMADKIANVRIFADDDDRMNRSVLDVGGELLVVSQFTLYGDVRRGRRPSFVESAPGDVAAPVVDALVSRLEATGVPVAQGVFGARMSVEILNEGPVTLMLDSADR